MSLSVCTVCSNPISLEFPLRECLLSVTDIADEIILINGDDIRPGDTWGEVNKVIQSLPIHTLYKLTVYQLPWRNSFRKNMSAIAMSAAISQCTRDYVLWLDADEVIHENNHADIRNLINLGHDAYSFRTIHFYKDYEHYKIPSDRWYNHRPKLFKNYLGIWDGYQSWVENCEVKREFTADLITWDYKPVHSFSIKVKIPVYHYGWVRSTETMTKKQNEIEKRHHPDFKSFKEYKWDMSDTEVFKGTHPLVMKERISGK